VQAGCVVLGKRTVEKDGYSAIIVGLGTRKEKRTTKPLKGQFEGGKKGGGLFKDAKSPAKQVIREMRLSPEDAAKFEIGKKLPVEELFTVGQFVDAQGTTRGRGFTGVMRRWNFAGSSSDTHGTHEYRRHGGAIGTNMTPGRVFPGIKMPGQYGASRVTVQNLRVAKVMDEQNIVLVEGGVPGARSSLVTVRTASKTKRPQA